jgi:hypothetical protein
LIGEALLRKTTDSLKVSIHAGFDGGAGYFIDMRSVQGDKPGFDWVILVLRIFLTGLDETGSYRVKIEKWTMLLILAGKTCQH